MLALAIGLLGWRPAQLGLRLPQASVQVPSSVLFGMLMGFVLLAIFFAVVRIRNRKSGLPRQKPRIAANAQVMQMLPRSSGERRAFALLAVTAGITEEIIWRGVGMALLVAPIPGARLIVDIVILAAVFGWAHLYQGVAGMLSTAVLGGMLTLLYLATGSLLLPMVLHVLIDPAVILRAPAEEPDVAAMQR